MLFYHSGYNCYYHKSDYQYEHNLTGIKHELSTNNRNSNLPLHTLEKEKEKKKTTTWNKGKIGIKKSTIS